MVVEEEADSEKVSIEFAAGVGPWRLLWGNSWTVMTLPLLRAMLLDHVEKFWRSRGIVEGICEKIVGVGQCLQVQF